MRIFKGNHGTFGPPRLAVLPWMNPFARLDHHFTIWEVPQEVWVLHGVFLIFSQEFAI
jgi:hypothetical protein